MVTYVVVKRDSSEAAECASRVLKHLLEHGAAVVMVHDNAACIRMLPPQVQLTENADTALRMCDAVVAVGGDGTIFHAASDALGFEKPVLGINAGRLGFLAQMEKGDISQLDDFIAGNYDIEQCLVIEAEVLHRISGERQTIFAVNDVVISKSDTGHLSDIEIYCDGDPVGKYRADGVIFAAPTGSTAYSLSAGGPICDPTASCIIMTPLASHSLVSRSIIFSDEKQLTVCAPHASGETLNLTVDGRTVDKISDDAVVTVRKYPQKSRFIRLRGNSFYKTLNDKMKYRG